MTLVSPLSPKSLRLANPDHPRFVGLALLRSLLLHEDVASSPTRSDAVLDLIGLLLRDAPARQVVKAFCLLRQQCGSVCYLAIFRLRRWLEKEVVVKAGADAVWQPLELAFQTFPRMNQHYRRQVWERNLVTDSWEQIPVDFAWDYSEAEPQGSPESKVISVDR